ncbi:hypothetical protein VTN77DRAFT_8438 [Rasamsonia byssochlamydoides]|uniref:uncharacterized protein n=1 Tax=Rasamsonia byssochlamydoides TaxID=89139 RepID=UPI003743C9D7
MTADENQLLLVKSPLTGNKRKPGFVDDGVNIATCFFDLFFVANLTSFTNAHEINSLSKLSSYVGFFSVLWLTWCQVTLYDVRFATDSVFERVAHACYFGVMVGLAIIGPQFDDPRTVPWSVLQELSLILMASRAVLFFQYGTTLYFVWHYRASRRPLIAVMATLAIASLLYLAMSFAFYLHTASNAYFAWYVIAVCEVGANLGIAKWSDAISFQHTHLVERMTCLTLIILGEGIIGLCKTITKIETLDFGFSPAAIGSVISAVLIIYFLYQLYFDNVHLEPFDSLRQQIWAGLHFPFHLALVLLMEGTNQVFVWSHIAEDVRKKLYALIDLPANPTPQQFFNVWNSTITSVFEVFPSNQDVYDEVQRALQVISPTSNATDAEANSELVTLVTDMSTVIFEGFGWEVPEILALISRMGTSPHSTKPYFCISAGIVLISIGVLTFVAYGGDVHHHRNQFFRFLSISANILAGIGVALLSMAVLTGTSTTLGGTPWTLPMLVLLLLILLVINHIPDQQHSRQRDDPEFQSIYK